jgi:hypothetical protein
VALRSHIWLIGAAVYMVGMFPLFFLYQAYTLDRFGLTITRATLISIFGAVGLLFLQMVVAAWRGAAPSVVRVRGTLNA